MSLKLSNLLVILFKLKRPVKVDHFVNILTI